MSDDDDDDDLFGGKDGDDGESDDTNDLIAASKPVATKKSTAATAAPAKKKPAAASKKPSADDDSDDGKGLFDSDSDKDDDDDDKKKKPVAKKKIMSKRERLEALAANKKKNQDDSAPKKSNKKPSSTSEKASGGAKRNQSDDDDDSINSAEIHRTKEDDDFLDTTGEDPDAVQELYAAQHFDDEPEDDEYYGSKKSKTGHKKSSKRKHSNSGEALEVGPDGGEPDNPIMAAVYRMKKKKKEKRSALEMEDECKEFLIRMEKAAEEDEAAMIERKPATKKLSMLNDVINMLNKRDLQRILLDLDLLSICKRWVQPLANGTLGNVTVRQRLLESIANMTGESGINANDLKRSELGRVVMVLYKHRSETPAMKRQLKTLIEQWSRPIFQKSGNMRDLERVHATRGESGLAAFSRQQQQLQRMTEGPNSHINKPPPSKGGSGTQDLDALITSGRKSTGESGINRVRVPYSTGFHYTVRPGDKTSEGGATGMSPPDKRGAASGTGETRDKLKRRMLEKGRVVGKNQRSANISVEGRPTK